MFCLQAGQTATQAVAPKSAAKPKSKAAAAAAALSDDARTAMAMVEAAAAELPKLERERWAVQRIAGTVLGSATPCSCLPHKNAIVPAMVGCMGAAMSVVLEHGNSLGRQYATHALDMTGLVVLNIVLLVLCSLNFAPSGMFGGGGMEERPPPNPGAKVCG